MTQGQEESDARAVDVAIRMLMSGNDAGAERLLTEVAGRTPAGYRSDFEHDGTRYLKAWTRDEFLHEVLRHKESGRQTPVTWLPNAYPRAHYYLGYLAVKRGRNLEAVRWLDAGQALEPRSAHFRLEKAQALGGLQRRKEALTLFDEVLAMGDEVPAPLRAVAMRGRGFQLIEFGRLDEAEAIFKESLKLDPENRVALNELKYIREVREGREHGGVELVETKGPAPATTCDLCAGPLGEAWDVEKRGGRVLHICKKCATSSGPR